jgi:hypothetical protein
MANFADNFQTLCDRVVTIVGLIKDDRPFRKRPINIKGRTTTTADFDGRVFDFGEDLRAIREIAERVELKLFKYIGVMEEVTNDVATLTNKLVALRLDAPNSMLVYKEIDNGTEAKPKDKREYKRYRQGDEKKPSHEKA